MKFNVKNDSHRARALSAANGGMTIVPPNSEDVYDLDPDSRFKSGADLFITELSGQENSQESTVSEPVAPAPAVEPKKQQAGQKTAVPVAIKASDGQPEAEAPADWQKGLEAPK